MSVFKDKTLLITGGTGSFGNAVLRRFLDSDIKEIRILSRDEKKQDDMRHFLQANRGDVAHKVKFYIGNVRQREAVDFAMAGVDYVFSAAVFSTSRSNGAAGMIRQKKKQRCFPVFRKTSLYFCLCIESR